jgi:hypothetical protein
VIGDARCHRRCDALAERRVGAAVVVVEEVDADGRGQLLQLRLKALVSRVKRRMPIRSAAGRSWWRCGRGRGRGRRHDAPSDARADGGAVAPLTEVGAEDLLDLRVVNLIAERGLDGGQVGRPAIRRQLDALGQPPGQVAS